MEKAPETSRRVGAGAALVLIAVSFGSYLALITAPAWQRFRAKRLLSYTSVEDWAAMLRRARPDLQRELLSNFDHQSFNVSPARFHDALVGVAGAVKAEPALSRYWILRSKMEAIERQARVE